MKKIKLLSLPLIKSKSDNEKNVKNKIAQKNKTRILKKILVRH